MKNGFLLSKWPAFAMQLRLRAFSSSCIFSFCCLLSPGRAAAKPQKGRLERGAPEGLWSAQKWNRTTADPVLPYVILSDNEKVKKGQ